MKLLIIVILLYVVNLNSQNIIKNSGFEVNSKALDNGLDSEIEFWESMSNATLCDQNVKNLGVMRKKEDCPAKFKAFKGTNYVKLSSSLQCGCSKDGVIDVCPTYLYQELAKPLAAGKYYKVSMWVYCPVFYTNQDTVSLDYYGLMLSYEVPKREWGLVIRKNVLHPSKMILDRWHKLEWVVKAGCEQRYVTIGMFKGEDWKRDQDKNKYFRSMFLIDNIEIVEISESQTNDYQVLDYCNELPEPINPVNPKMTFVAIPKTTLRYSPNETYLNTNSSASLDSLAELMRQKPQSVFIVSGHTDDEGVQNAQISKDRTLIAINHLSSKHNIGHHRLIPFFAKDSRPLQTNHTLQGRAQNRRVEIEEIPLPLVNAYYRKAWDYAKRDKIDSAFVMLNNWSNGVAQNEIILALFDSCFIPMHKHSKWKSLYHKIRKSYARPKYKLPEMAFRLDSLYAEDQKYRMTSPNLAGYITDLGGYLKDIDTANWHFIYNDAIVSKLDNSNLAFLKNILKTGHFPKQSEVGRRPAKGALLVLIHSGDMLLMEKYLNIIEEYCNSGEASCELYAILFDKIRLLKGLPQRFGTQWITENGQQKLWATEDEANLKARRQAIGLD